MFFVLQLPDLKDAEAVQKFFLEEIQLGEELLAQGNTCTHQHLFHSQSKCQAVKHEQPLSLVPCRSSVTVSHTNVLLFAPQETMRKVWTT